MQVSLILILSDADAHLAILLTPFAHHHSDIKYYTM